MSIKAAPTGHSRILSVGTYRPKRTVPNSEIVDRIDSTDEWIVQRTGIESRRFAGDDETVISMAKAACEMALSRAKLTIADIDTVILATISYPFQAPRNFYIFPKKCASLCFFIVILIFLKMYSSMKSNTKSLSVGLYSEQNKCIVSK